MDMKLVSKLMKEAPPITIGQMLKEFRRTNDYFKFRNDVEGQVLALDLGPEVAKEYLNGFCLDPPLIADPTVNPESAIPDNIRKKYLMCNVYCAQLLKKNLTVLRLLPFLGLSLPHCAGREQAPLLLGHL
jgi:hypothetical protein